MNKILIIFLICVSNNAFAENPYEMFSTDKNMTNSTKINWKVVENVQQECNKQRTSHGGKPYSYKVDACSAWTKSIFGNTCEIITSKKVNMHIIGHEVRHCFQGDFHK